MTEESLRVAREIVECSLDQKCSCWLTDSPCEPCDGLVEGIATALDRQREELEQHLKDYEFLSGTCRDDIRYAANEIRELQEEVVKLIADMKWIRQTVHQAHHEGEIEGCRKNICDAVAQAFLRREGDPYVEAFGKAMNDYHQAYIREKKKVDAMRPVIDAARKALDNWPGAVTHEDYRNLKAALRAFDQGEK